MGAPFHAYLAKLSCHSDKWRQRYDDITVRDVWVNRPPSAAHGPVKALVFSEAWCIDAVLNVPILQRICEIDSMVRLRILTLADYRSVANRLSGAKPARIPTIVFFRGDAAEVWIERSRPAGEWFQHFRRGDPLPPIVIADGRPATRELEAWMARRFEAESQAERGRLWEATVSEWRVIIARLAALRPTHLVQGRWISADTARSMS